MSNREIEIINYHKEQSDDVKKLEMELELERLKTEVAKRERDEAIKESQINNLTIKNMLAKATLKISQGSKEEK